jgi:hypothetical protein
MAAAVNADAVTVISRLPQSAGLLAEQIASGEYAAISRALWRSMPSGALTPMTEVPRRTITSMYLIEISAAGDPGVAGHVPDDFRRRRPFARAG